MPLKDGLVEEVVEGSRFEAGGGVVVFSRGIVLEG